MNRIGSEVGQLNVEDSLLSIYYYLISLTNCWIFVVVVVLRSENKITEGK